MTAYMCMNVHVCIHVHVYVKGGDEKGRGGGGEKHFMVLEIHVFSVAYIN